MTTNSDDALTMTEQEIERLQQTGEWPVRFRPFPWGVATMMAVLVGFLVCLGFALFTTGCRAGWDDPPRGPQADNPCGFGWQQCEVRTQCCPDHHTCGGDPHAVGCPAGQCCYLGGDQVGSSHDVPQRSLCDAGPLTIEPPRSLGVVQELLGTIDQDPQP